MDSEKKYLKYKIKYLNLKNNIKGGMIDVLRLPVYESKEETKLKDVIDLEYINLIKFYYKTQFENHVHKLLGFYDLESSESYHIENIIINNKKSDESQIILNNINIEDKLIENELYDDLTILSQIKSNIISYLKENKNKLKYMNNVFLSGSSIIEIDNCDITVNFIKLEKKQTGGFDPKIICFRSKMNGLIKVYSEPIIEFINNFVSMSYHKLKSDGKKHNYPIENNGVYNYISDAVNDDDLQQYYDMIFDIIYKKDIYGELDFVKKILTKIKFSKDMLRDKIYIREILLEHLLNNKYAHNGIDNIEILKSANKIITNAPTNAPTDTLEINNLVFLHSYLHYLDDLNMLKETEIAKINLPSDSDIKDIRKDLRGCFKKGVAIICFENILNSNQYDFLQKGTEENSEKYKFPYRIKKEALQDKIRQYSSSRKLYQNFHEQISDFGSPIDSEEYIGEPYGLYEYLKKYYNTNYPNLDNFIKSNAKLQKITEINNSFPLIDIVNIFNKHYKTEKEIKKYDIIDLILLYFHNYSYIKEETV